MNGRRTFVRWLALGIVAAPLVAEAQPAGKVWRIGFLYAGPKIDAARLLRPFLELPLTAQTAPVRPPEDRSTSIAEIRR